MVAAALKTPPHKLAKLAVIQEQFAHEIPMIEKTARIDMDIIAKVLNSFL